MRVAMVGPFGLKPKGTMAVRALPLAKTLVQNGHRVTMILPPWSFPEHAGQVWEQHGVRIDNVAISPLSLVPLRMVRRVRTFQPDVIYVFKPKAYSGIAQWLLWQLRRVGATRARILLDQDDWEGAGGWNDLERYSPLQKLFFAWQEQWGLRHADAVTVASRALETLAWSLGIARNRVLYLPNGVNPLPEAFANRQETRDALKLGTSPVLLLYTRFFEFGLQRLVEILSQVFQHVTDAKLLVIGKGLFDQERQFQEMAAAAGWHDRVVNAGWVEPDRLRSLFAAADVAVFPFDDTLVNRCKCSVKLIDLLASGVPVVADAVGQNTEYIRHNENGLVVAPNDTLAFASAVISLLHDPEERARLGRGASANMEREFAWSRLAEVLGEIVF